LNGTARCTLDQWLLHRQGYRRVQAHRRHWQFRSKDAAVPLNIAEPVISGDIDQGDTLTANVGSWLNDPVSYAYAWSRDGTPIGAATSSTYVVTGPDVGHLITVAVVATNATGSSAAAVSAPVTPTSAS
jgi:hypothetical protein